MAPLAVKQSICGTKQVPSLASEKATRNKRKFRAETPSDHIKSLSSSLDDLPPYEFSAENFGVVQSHGLNGACDMCGGNQNHLEGFSGPLFVESSQMKPGEPIKEIESSDFKDADWSELTEAQLEELVLSILDTIFKSAIRKIVAYGYTEEAATKAIMRTGISYGFKGTLSNIVDNAITFLRTSQEADISRESYFQNLQQLGTYILAELVCILRALRPSFSTGDAMWYLLICDMNISQACTMDTEGEPLSNPVNDKPLNGSSSNSTENQQDTHIKNSEVHLSDSSLLAVSSPSLPPEVPNVSGVPHLAKSKKSSIVNKAVADKKMNSTMNQVDVGGTSQMLGLDGKSSSKQKVHLSSSSKRELLLVQKTLRLDALGYKGALKAGKMSSASANFDRKLKSMTHSGGRNQKNVSMKISKTVGIKITQEHAKPNHDAAKSNSSQPTLPSSIVPPPLPMVNNPAVLPVAETELSLLPPGTKDCPLVPIGSALGVYGLNVDEFPPNNPLSQFSGPETRDSIIAKLVPRAKELQSELDQWTEWANQKVMQAARRLRKDKAELKSLRQEKEEAEKLKRDKKMMEENTLKKLSEMESALSKASGQVERANSTFRRLEVENAALRKEMEAARLQAAESSANCQEVSKREKKTLTEIQSWEKQKNLFQEELATEKRNAIQVEKELRHARHVLWQIEARYEQEKKLKEDLMVQATSIKKEIEQAGTLAKSKEQATKLKAVSSLQKYKEDIQKLEVEISQLRLDRDSSKIAALRKGIDGSYASNATILKNNSPIHKADQVGSLPSKTTSSLQNSNNGAAASVRRNRECVMCLSEEMSVVFLPCAHQVVCAKCNELHEKRGMKECPSCRSQIERRIDVRYAISS